MNSNTNKWLDSSLPAVDTFEVDKTKDTYHIQYYETKNGVSNLNDEWNNLKNYIITLKVDIEGLCLAIESEDYKAKTDQLTKALDEAVEAIDNNLIKLFNTVVHKMQTSAESDGWFAETAKLYAEYIASAILGNKYTPGGGEISATNVSYSAPTTSGGNNAVTMFDNPTDQPNFAFNHDAISAPTTGEGAEPVLPPEETPEPVLPPNETPVVNETPTPSESPASTSSNGNVDISKYNSKPEKGFVVTTDNQTYNLSDSDIDLIVAIVSAESDKSYDDALAVASTILNRCEAPNWVASHGTDPVKQATAPNQFVVYQHGSYKSYLGDKAPETCRQAVMDALNGVRNHDYLSFRSNGSTGYSSNQITSTGNRYK